MKCDRKKIGFTLRALLSVTAALTFSSCVYEAAEDYSGYFSKTQYKAFDSLSSPVIFNLPFEISLNSTTDKSLTAVPYDAGSFFVIWDSETDSVYDYVYASGGDGTGNSIVPCYSTDSGKLYVDRDNDSSKVYTLNPSENSLSYKIHRDSEYQGKWIVSSSDNEKYALYYDVKSYSTDGENTVRFYVFNPEDSSFGKPLTYKTNFINSISAAYNEGENCFYLMDHGDFDSSNGCTYRIFKINVAENSISDVLCSFYSREGLEEAEESSVKTNRSYEITGTENRKLFVRQRQTVSEYDEENDEYYYDIENSLLVYDVDSFTYEKASVNSAEKAKSLSYVSGMFKINGSWYILMSDGSVYSFDADSLSVSLCASPSFSVSLYTNDYSYAQAGSRIWFSCYSSSEEKLKFFYFDTQSLSYSEYFSLTVKELFE